MQLIKELLRRLPMESLKLRKSMGKWILMIFVHFIVGWSVARILKSQISHPQKVKWVTEVL